MTRRRLDRRAAKRGQRASRRLMAELLETRRLLSITELEPNETPATATPFSVVSSEVPTGNISSLTDVDVFRVALTQGQRISINPRNSTDGTFNPALPVPVAILGSDGEVEALSRDNRQVDYTVPADGDYYIRFTSDSAYGEFASAYAPTVSITSYSGTTETEPNDTTASANGVTPPSYFRGTIADINDVDGFSFAAAAGQAVVVQFSDAPASRPALRLYDAGGTLVASSFAGEGLRWTVPANGAYYLSLSSDNVAASFTGQYVAYLSVQNAGAWSADPSGRFDTATNWDLKTASSLAIGSLSSLSDIDYFCVHSDGLDFFTFHLAAAGNDTLSAENRVITLYDDMGRVLQYSTDGWLDTRNGGRPTRTGRYFISVQATAETGVGPYVVSGVVSSRFNAQRDVPLYFIDFDGQTPHLGFEWVAPYASPAAIPHVVGRFESVYDIYDIDITLANPPNGTEMVDNGIGDFGDIGAGGWGGGSFGVRRPRGGSVSLDTNGLPSFQDGGVITLLHEAGHATGLPHTRSVLDYMGYDNDMELNPVGSLYPFYGTDSRVADTRNINQRDYLDWALQAGVQIPEVEANDLRAAAQDLDPHLAEMSWELEAKGKYDAGQSLSFLVAGDFNADSRPDLAAASPVDKTVRVFLGNGDGTFQDVASYAVGSLPWWTESLAVGDFNGDGYDDIVAADGDDMTISVLLARSDGAFQPAVTVAVAGQTRAAATADFNGDGNVDIAVTTWWDVRVLLGNGDGSFQTPQSYSAGGYGIVVGDFNGDGCPDLATANIIQGSAAVLLNDGTGGFQAAVSYPTGPSPYSLTTGDFNGDGGTDLAVGDRGDRDISLLLGNGNGTFGAAIEVPLSVEAVKVRAADVDGNGTSDLLVGTWGGALISLLGMGDGTFSREIGWGTDDSPLGVISVELNGDGRPDLAAATYWGKDINVLLGQPNDVRNDRAVVYGSISSPNDADFFQFTATAGTSYAVDIDAAEFQYSLDATLVVFGPHGTPIDLNSDGLDRDSGLASVDPYLTFTASETGLYGVRVTGEEQTAGNYRLKITPEQAADQDGPRVIYTQPQGTTRGTRQLLFWLNDQLDPATLNGANIIVQGATTGIHSGTALFDPLSSLLIWKADAQLPPDSYTVTLSGGADGVADLRGNLLDGESDGSLTLPEISGNGAPGGDFVTTLTISTEDTTAARLTGSPSYSRHPYNRGHFTLRFTDILDVASVQTADFRLRAAGPDNSFATADDDVLPVDVWYDTFRYSSISPSTSPLHVYTRGVPAPGLYLMEAAFLDAAGYPILLSSVVTVGSTPLYSGPVVTDVNFQPNSVSQTLATVAVDFSEALDLTTLTTANMRLYFSPDPDFFDGNDSQVDDADGAIAWDATYHRAVFQPAVPLQDGYYLLELNGDLGGLADTRGRLLDGEFLDTAIPGADSIFLWPDSPSGDGAEGGDYRVFFSVLNPGAPSVTLTLAGSPLAEASGTATVTATLSAVSNRPVTVILAFSGTATQTTDYNPSATSITIPPDSPNGWITLTALQDALDEADETIMVDIETVTNAFESGTQQVTATITDDDLPPAVTLSLTDSPMSEDGGVATVKATLSAVSGLPVTVHLAFSGTATMAVDYNPLATSITIPAGEATGVITLKAEPDWLDEANETIVVGIESVTNGTKGEPSEVTATITNVDLVRFFVVDNLVEDTFGYAADGGNLSRTALASAVTDPRGIAINADATKFWILNYDKVIYVQSGSGQSLGSWSSTQLKQPTGVAISGSDVWIADKGTDTVYRYDGAADVTSGQLTASFSFKLNAGNATPEGLATDGTKLWVVDGDKPDAVYLYDTSGASLGSWSIDPANTSPTGIAIDPAGASQSIWIVDISKGRVYEYANARSRTSGSQSAASSFALISANASPHDIAVRGLSTSLQLRSIGAQDIAAESELSFAVNAADNGLPAGTLTYAASGLPPGAVFDPATHTFRWTPVLSQAPGTYAVTFSVSNGVAFAAEEVVISVFDPYPWQNHGNPPDADGSGRVSPIDALVIINRINLFGSGLLPSRQPEDPYFDVSRDGRVGPDDTLMVINCLNAEREAEGESGLAEAGDESRARALVPLNVAAAMFLPTKTVSDGWQAGDAAVTELRRSEAGLAGATNAAMRASDGTREELLAVLAASRSRTDWQAAADGLLAEPDWLLDLEGIGV